MARKRKRSEFNHSSKQSAALSGDGAVLQHHMSSPWIEWQRLDTKYQHTTPITPLARASFLYLMHRALQYGHMLAQVNNNNVEQQNRIMDAFVKTCFPMNPPGNTNSAHHHQGDNNTIIMGHGSVVPLPCSPSPNHPSHTGEDDACITSTTITTTPVMSDKDGRQQCNTKRTTQEETTTMLLPKQQQQRIEETRMPLDEHICALERIIYRIYRNNKDQYWSKCYQLVYNILKNASYLSEQLHHMPEVLVVVDHVYLARDTLTERNRHNYEEKVALCREMIKNADIFGPPPEGSKAVAVCNRCMNTKVAWIRVQVRGCDEPMTTFFTCLNKECNNKWSSDSK